MTGQIAGQSMTTFQHLMFAFCGGLPLWIQMCAATDLTIGWMNPMVQLFALAVGFLAPDIEYIDSYIWELIRPYSVLIATKGVHDRNGRTTGFFHSFAGFLAATAFYYILVWTWCTQEERAGYVGYHAGMFAAGYALHLLQDALCLPGIRLLWPAGRRFALTDLEQPADMTLHTYVYTGSNKKRYPCTAFTWCLILVTWAACYYTPMTVRSIFLLVSAGFELAMGSFLQALCALFTQSSVLTVLRTLLLAAIVPVLFRNILTDKITKRRKTAPGSEWKIHFGETEGETESEKISRIRKYRDRFSRRSKGD